MRCLIWLAKALQQRSGGLLYQTVWLKKGMMLLDMEQVDRSLENFKGLLALQGLDMHLHEQVIDKFWKPLKRLIDTKSVLKVEPLLQVQSLQVIDRSFPEFWGFPRREFEPMINALDKYIRISERQTIHDFWEDAGPQRDVAPARVSVNDEIRIRVALRNRFTFPVYLHMAQLHATSQSGDTIISEPMQGVEIPGFAQKQIHVELKLRPNVVGRFAISRIWMGYFEQLTSETEVEQLSFKAVNGFPRVLLQVANFPEELKCCECHQFVVKVKNVSSDPVENVGLFYDNRDVVLPMVTHKLISKLAFVLLPQAIQPNETAEIAFVCRMNNPGHHSIHFFTTINKVRSGFAIAKCRAIQALRIDSRLLSHPFDTKNRIVHCTVRSDVEQVAFAGFMNKQGKLLRTRPVPPVSLSRGQPFSFDALTCDEDVDVEDSWRVDLVAKSSFALLLKVGDSPFYAQANLSFDQPVPDFRFQIEMRDQYRRGDSIVCSVSLQQPNDPETVLFIEPIPPRRLDETTRERVIGGQWVGVRRKELSQKTGFVAEFLLGGVTCGLFCVETLTVARAESDQEPKVIKLVRHFRVLP
jgi:hypothetical protein